MFSLIEHVKTTLVPADKTSNSIVIVCGKDYLKELDTSDAQQTYARCGTPTEILVAEYIIKNSTKSQNK